jgi:hypothetical protein
MQGRTGNDDPDDLRDRIRRTGSPVILTRLQLAVGQAVTLLGETPADGPRRRFAGHGPGDAPDGPPTRRLILFPPPPDGPPSGALLDRMASIRAIGHAVLAAPLATGSFEGHAWAVEPLPATATLAERIAAGERLSVPVAVRVLREVARGLAGLHRHNLAHGALTADAVTVQQEVVTLYHLASRHDGSTAEDLMALGRLGRELLTGPEGAQDVTPLRELRPTVPEELDQLIAGLTNPGAKTGPASAAEVLEALDALPVPEPSLLGMLMESAGRGSRVTGRRRTTAVLLGLGVIAAIIWLLARVV